MLTHEDIKTFSQPLPLNDHEVKIKVKARKDEKTGKMKKSMWLVYIDQTAIIPLIQSVDPNYSWLIVDKQRADTKLCVVTGRLIIGGNSYDGVGGATPNYDADPYSEDTEKAAETDAFKRAAVKVGIGLYTRSIPQFWVDGDLGDGYEARDNAWKQFEAWYRKEYGYSQGAQPRETPAVGNNPPQQPQNAKQTPSSASNGHSTNGTAKHFACAKMTVLKRGENQFQYIAKCGHNINIVEFSRDKYRAVLGEQVETWNVDVPPQGKMLSFEPELQLEAVADGQGFKLVRVIG